MINNVSNSRKIMSRFGDLLRGKGNTSPEPTVEPVVESSEPDLKSMSKDDLENYGRTVGIELDRRHNKAKLITELTDHIKKI